MTGRLGAALSLSLLALAGCMGGGAAAIEPDEAGAVVLAQADVPAAFSSFDVGRMSRADLPGGARADAARFGREEGWKARYRRAGTPDTGGPLVIESRVDVFESAGGAEDELAAIRAELASPPQPVVTPTTALPDPDLGDGAVAWSALLPSQPRDAVFFNVAWRHENAVATVAVSGFAGRLALEDALELARKQQARLEDAT